MEQIFLELKKGDSFSRTLIFENEDGTRLDISAWKLYFMAKSSMTDLDNAAIITKTITSHSSTQGETELILTTTETDVAVGNYPFALKVITGNLVGGTNEALTLIEGTLVVSDRVIQAVS